MDLKCQLVKKLSKAGNEYYCIEIYLTKDYKKVVFCDQSELELIKLYASLNSSNK